MYTAGWHKPGLRRSILFQPCHCCVLSHKCGIQCLMPRCYFLFIKCDVGKVRYKGINLCQTSVFHFPCQAWLVRGSLSSGSSFRLMGWSHCCNMAWGTYIINTDVLILWEISLFSNKSRLQHQSPFVTRSSINLSTNCAPYLLSVYPAVGRDACMVCGSLPCQREERRHHGQPVGHRDPKRDRYQ